MHNEATFQFIGRISKITRFPKVLKIDLAINSPSKNAAGQWEENTDWLTVTTFDNDMDFVEKKRKQGDLVLIKGRVASNNYTDKDGKKVYGTDHIGNSFKLLDRPGSKAGSPEE